MNSNNINLTKTYETIKNESNIKKSYIDNYNIINIIIINIDIYYYYIF